MSRNGKACDHRKQSLYIPNAMLEEMRAEAKRQDRSLSWLIQQAWSNARRRIIAFGDVEIAMKEQIGLTEQ